MSLRQLVRKLEDVRSKLETLSGYYVPRISLRVKQVDIDFIAKRLQKLPNWSWHRWLPLDGNYYTVSLEEFKKIIEWDRTNRHQYYYDRFDCDKYAMYFKSHLAWYFGINAVGVILDYGSAHAYNLLLPHDRDEPLLFEPQTDKVFTIEERDRRFYGLKDYLVLL